MKQETSGLYFPCHGPWHRLNGSEEEIYRDNRGRQTGRGERSEEERQKKEDRQTWSGDRIKEKGRITVNKKKTPTTTLCQCQVCKKHTAWKPERGESQYALEPREANSNTTTLGWILQGALWDSLIMGEAKERRWGNTGLVSIMLSVWNPNSLLLSLAHPVSHFWRFASSPLNPVYLFICMENIGHAFIQGHTFLIVLQL